MTGSAANRTRRKAASKDAPGTSAIEAVRREEIGRLVGRIARGDDNKWSSNTWRISDRITYRYRQSLVMGVDERTLSKLGPPPPWASILRPMAIPTPQFFATLHCLLPVNGGARENSPRAGLKAFAAGVPVIVQNDWGWKEMIDPQRPDAGRVDWPATRSRPRPRPADWKARSTPASNS